MPYGSWINDLPTAFFLVVHIAAFAIGAGFAWLAFKRELTLLGTGLLAVRRRRARLHDLPPRLDRVPVRAHDRRGARPGRLRARLRGRRLADRRRAPAGRGADPLMTCSAASSSLLSLALVARRGGLRRRRRAASPWRRPRSRWPRAIASTRRRSRSRPARRVTWTNNDNFTHTVQVDGQEDHKVEPRRERLDRVRQARHLPLRLHAPQPATWTGR